MIFPRSLPSLFVMTLLGACAQPEPGPSSEGSELRLTARSTYLRAAMHGTFTQDYVLEAAPGHEAEVAQVAEIMQTCSDDRGCQGRNFQVCEDALKRIPRFGISKFVHDRLGSTTSVPDFVPITAEGVEVLEPGKRFRMKCGFTATASYVLSNHDQRDLSAFDGKTHQVSTQIESGVRVTAYDAKTYERTTEPLATTIPIQAVLEFEPVTRPPVLTPRYDQLAKEGTLTVLYTIKPFARPSAYYREKGIDEYHEADPEDGFFGSVTYAQAEDWFDGDTKWLEKAGYRVVERHESSRERLTEGQGGWIRGEKTLANGTRIELVMVGPILDTALVSNWAKQADVLVFDSYYGGGLEDREGRELLGNPERYRIEINRSGGTEAPSHVSRVEMEKHLALGDGRFAGDWFSPGARDRLFLSSSPTKFFDDLATNVTEGKASFNDMMETNRGLAVQYDP